MAQLNQDDARHRLSNSQNRQTSIKKRLLVSIAGVLFITWLIATVFTKYLAWDTTSEFLLQQTQRLANSWIELIAEPQFNDVRPYNDAESTQLVLGWRDDVLVLQQAPFSLDKPSENKTHRITIDKHKWALSSICHDNACVITGLRDSERKYAVRGLMVVIFLPLLFIFCLSMLAMYYAVKYALMPLNQLTTQVSGVSAKALNRITSDTRHQELTPLIKALNQLIDNMKKQLTKERHFLDTCTHELRTPVTALLAQIQNIQALPELPPSTNYN